MPKAAEKPTREQKKAARAAKRQARRETWSNIRQAFTLTRRNDPRMLPYLIMAVVVTLAVVYVVVFLISGSPYLPIPLAILLAVLVGMLVFTRRAQGAMYAQIDGQAGAAASVLDNANLRGDWSKQLMVAGTTQLDAVHRLIGRAGVVLVGEGAPHRVRGLLAQERKKVARVVGDTPIYTIVVGDGGGEDEVPLAKLQTHLMRKLPNNLSRDEVSALKRRMAALTSTRPPMPQGPMPAGAKMRNVQRAVRRRS